MTPDDPRAALYAALVAERHNGGGWGRPGKGVTPAPKPTYDDSELTCARRRREALADLDALHETERSTRVVPSG